MLDGACQTPSVVHFILTKQQTNHGFMLKSPIQEVKPL